ncbi:glucose-6-phosphate isomerase [Dethiosulfatarculus sandiegensis]|uniref:Glucose-6-phosphate isomerase n=1 Tax=Dethiosulfatarculus sandiegensis TaxID=1429043 RepID=A0A0D2JX02_9BACT|nr:glucose-6-phosphate isomerase [Dethiosulfatarculus sandiegensis]KIX14100.1 hypothetical protein X474_10730 [Dethiosulfatarculus sandiegensis]
MSEDMVRLDYSYCTAEAVGQNGFSDADLDRIGKDAALMLDSVLPEAKQGKPGFMALPFMTDDELDPVLKEAGRLKDLADTLVVLGIGGSALGATAVDMALAGSLRNSFARPHGCMRLFVADNPDPRSFGMLLHNLDLNRTVFNVVSKSGSTAETMAQFMVVMEMLKNKMGWDKAAQRVVFTTDPEKGNLRLIAQKEGDFRCLEVPPDVGGRFSVLSPVGLLPLAAAGHNIKVLLSGARAMYERCLNPDFSSNPAALLAGLTVEYMHSARNILVMMPYATDLFGLAQWFAQLWAESLGKASDLDGKEVHAGQTPVAAVGATDQHSQLQLYIEGPQDKLVLFATLDDMGGDIPIPGLFQDIDSISYLGGASMGALIKSEAKATQAALAQQKRPSLNLRLPRLDAHCLGQVLFLLEAATLMAGKLLRINPLDQPGVELGKVLTYGLMGRKGFEQEAKRMAEIDFGGKRLV